MATNPKDGGPAFPVSTSCFWSGDKPCAPYGHQDGAATWQFGGMTLRDYFAARAMHAELVTCGVPGKACDALIQAIKETGETPEAHMARVAYEIADAMLAAREQVQP